MSSVLFSPIGASDPVRSEHDGPMMHILRHYRPEKVYLFLTKQMADREEKHNTYMDSIRYLSKECEVIRYFTEIGRPDDFDGLTIIASLLQEVEKENEGKTILLNISSGTPQIKSTLSMIATTNPNIYKVVKVSTPNNSSNNTEQFDPEKHILSEWMETNLDHHGEGANRCSEPYLWIFKRPMLRNEILSLIEGYNYAGALQLYESNKIILSDKIGLLLKHGYLRQNLEDKDAKEYAKKVDKYQQLYPTLPYDLANLLEYYLVMDNKYERLEYADLIVRLEVFLTSLQWIMLKEIVKVKKEDIVTKGKVEKWDIQALQTKFPNLQQYSNQEYSNEIGKTATFEWDRFINSKALTMILKYWNEQNEHKIQDVLVEIEKWRDVIEQLRNSVAHTITDVTAQSIYNVYGKNVDVFMTSLKTNLMKASNGKIKNEHFDIYKNINCFIREELDKQNDNEVDHWIRK